MTAMFKVTETPFTPHFWCSLWTPASCLYHVFMSKCNGFLPTNWLSCDLWLCLTQQSWIILDNLVIFLQHIIWSVKTAVGGILQQTFCIITNTMVLHSCTGLNYVFDQRVTFFRLGHYLLSTASIYIPAFGRRDGSETWLDVNSIILATVRKARPINKVFGLWSLCSVFLRCGNQHCQIYFSWLVFFPVASKF